MWFAHSSLQLRKCCDHQAVIPISLVNSVSGATQKPQGSEKNQDKLPSPPSASPLGQGRAEPQAHMERLLPALEGVGNSSPRP